MSDPKDYDNGLTDYSTKAQTSFSDFGIRFYTKYISWFPSDVPWLLAALTLWRFTEFPDGQTPLA